MIITSLKQVLIQAKRQKIALGHFNFSTIEVARAIVRAAVDTKVPVVLGVSEGEADFIGLGQAKALVDSLREQYSHPIFLNADHVYSLDRAKAAIDMGLDCLVFDQANASLNQNISLTKKVVAYRKCRHAPTLVEAELGYIGSSSKLLDTVPEAVQKTTLPTADQASHFVKQTNIDLLAPSVGNLHGMLKDSPNPRLNFKLIAQIKKATNLPLVLHGGSGILDQDFSQAIKVGITLVHINTQIRKAWRDSLSHSLSQNPKEVAPYKLLQPSAEAVYQIVKDRLQLFNRS